MNITERLFGVAAKEIKEDVIITPFLNVEYFAKTAKFRKTKGFLFEVLTQKELSVVKTGVGASFVGDAVMYLRDTPCRRLYFIGSCAGLSPYEVGDIICAEKAFAGESFSELLRNNAIDTSSCIVPENDLSDEFLKFCRARQGGERTRQRIQTASVATLGSLSLESALFDSLKQQGIGGVDMEVSAFLSAANSRGVSCLAVLYVTDTISKKLFFRDLAIPERKTIKTARQQAITLLCAFITHQNASKIQKKP